MANNNKHTGPNVPALRFPEFSGEWKTFQLSDLAAYSKERVKMEILSSNNYVSTENMQQNFAGIKDATSLPSSGIAVEFQVGDILISNIRPYLKKIWLSDRNGGCSTDVLALQTKNEIVDSSFLYCCLANDDFVSYVMSGAKGVKMPRGDKQHILSYNLGVPSVQEQRKIAELVSLLEKRISAQSKIIEEQETLLKSLADSLISSQVTNMAINDCVVARSSAMKESELENSGPFPVFGASGLCGYSNEALEESDSILVTKDGSGVGTCQYATGAHSFLGTLCSLTAKEGTYLPYVYYALLNFNFASFKTGLAIPHIYFKDYGNAIIYCPSYDEQVRIASGLEKIEAKIKSEKEILKQYQLQKEYLLSRMFI